MRCRWCIPLLIGSLCASLSPRRTAAQIPPGRETKLEAPAGRIFDLFGQAVALSPDDVAVVGAPADDSAAANAGAAYVFERTDGAWVLRAMLLAADAAPEDYFGRSVAVSDETILVGAPLDSNQGLFQAGSAYVFVRTGVATWAQQAKLVSGDPRAFGAFGSSVSIYGDTAIVGASGESFDKGAAYVFRRSGGAWTRGERLQPNNLGTNALFGDSGALSADTALIGAPLDSVNSILSGAVHVFVSRLGGWTRQGRLAPDDGQRLDRFGYSVTISGNTAVVGALFGDNGGLTQAGAVYVFERVGAAWSQTAKLVASDGADLDYFGGSVAHSGGTVLVGAPHDDNQNGAEAGAVYTFEKRHGIWSETGKLLAGDGTAGDRFGESLAWRGAVLVGASAGDGNVTDSGVAYVYDPEPPDLSIRGACPGPVTVTVTGAPPDSGVAVIAAATDRGWVKAGSVCSGTVFEIGEPFQLPPLLLETDENGFATGILTLQNDRCWLEALAFLRCETSPAVQVP